MTENQIADNLRLELLAVEQWIQPDSRVLDIGCGDGSLLRHLKENRQIKGIGVEIDADNITRCVKNGVHVIEQDIDQGLTNFATRSFDTVLLTQTLQAVRRPDYVLEEILRIGKECIITFPNFGHWKARLHLGLLGRMPVSRFMPYRWYDTPNIHFCTVKDFERLCEREGIRILDRRVQDNERKNSLLGNLWPNLFGTNAIYHVTK